MGAVIDDSCSVRIREILGRIRLRLQAASRERCFLQQRLTSQVVRAFCTLRFLERFDWAEQL